MASRSTSVDGFEDLDETLIALGKSTGKNVLRRVGRRMLEPMRDAAVANAPERYGDLKADIKVGTRLAPSQRRSQNRPVGGGLVRADPKNDVTLHMGPGQLPQAITSEFGTFQQAAEPYMRPAFDAEKDAAISTAGELLWEEIGKAAARKARKAARSGGAA